MTECILISESSYAYFEPLISNGAKRTLANDETVFAIGGILLGQAVGVMLVSVQKESAHILYLYVDENSRRCGVAKDMLRFLCKYAYEGELVIKCTFGANSIHDPMYALFRDSGVFAIEQRKGFTCSCPLSELESMGRIMSAKSLQGLSVKGVFDLPAKNVNDWYDKLRKEYNMIIEPTREGYDGEMSICTFDKDINITAALLVEGTKLSFVWCKGGNEANIIKLLYIEYELMLKRYGRDAVVYIEAINDSSIGLIDKLMPNKTVTSQMYEAVWDLELL